MSNFDVDDTEELFALSGGSACAANQILYNPEYRGIEFDLLPWSQRHNVAPMAYSPVGQGGNLLQSPVLAAIATEYNATPAQIALAWCLRQPVLAIPKAGTIEHVEENAAAAQLKLTPTHLAQIDKAFPAPKSKQRLATL